MVQVYIEFRLFAGFRVSSVAFTIRNSTFVIRHSKNGVMHHKAHRHLSTSDPRLAALIARSRRYNIKPSLRVRPFDALAESIAYQQLSGKAAATIWGRVRALFPGKHLDPQAVVAMPDEKLRAAGLSGSKVAALKDLAAKTIDGTVPSGSAVMKMADDEIIERLIAVRGIGRWTVEMLLLFDLGRPDVWPVHDYGIRKGFAKVFGKRKLPTPKQLLKLGEKWRPYRSAAAWYFWRALDEVEKAKGMKRRKG
jgi:DNA-3-methyladenine glycosylase II